MSLQLLYGAALLGASVQAFAFLPQPTDPFQALPLENGWTPRPTPAPEGQGLFKRQISLPESYLIAPDNTCGFINGNSIDVDHYQEIVDFTSESSSTETTSETTSETSEATTEEPASTTPPPTAATTVDSDRSSATTASTEPVASDAPSAPIGAIVGGVLGGIALIALAIFGAIFLRQHKKKSAAMAELPPPQPFMAQPTLPNTQPPAAPYAQDSASARMSGYAASSTSTPAHMYGAPVAAAAVGAGAGAAAAAGSFNSYHNHHPSNHTSNYPDHHANNNYHQDYHHHANSIHNTYPDHQPSPMTTPGGSPQPQYAHQPHAPPPLPAPSYYNNSPRHAWAAAELPDRRSTSTPVSTYNGTIPVSPASALGPMPGEQQSSIRGGGVSGVPLSLPSGMGYRPYRPPGAAAAGTGNAAPGPGVNRSGSGNGNGNSGMVVPRKAVGGGPASASAMVAQAVQVQGGAARTVQVQGPAQMPVSTATATATGAESCCWRESASASSSADGGG
ncbi:predicted protein [Chaetomium globosum CBS 148.51]|uniref:Mid2 domain-containing protein n=1 Tax=Chaetomium globosum (strain ATCC 6205 / CBS 148.51 / DSM 1962 / NBRC 6347 / NRRL 1970) TaxID=306901 RepID=Q2GW06_CHAGB|nr:uncharacterized protein CHGG_07848 [Chaetomium globosum CBS 148.51]EAQ86595.1 predicted protein [Chaetomium globosum CBS 148.51]